LMRIEGDAVAHGRIDSRWDGRGKGDFDGGRSPERPWGAKVGIKRGEAAVLERAVSRFIGCPLGEKALTLARSPIPERRGRCGNRRWGRDLDAAKRRVRRGAEGRRGGR
jgi:hypothetical protein